MKRLSYILLSLTVLCVCAALLTAFPRTLAWQNGQGLLSSIFFTESTTTAKLRESYDTGRRIRVLIVPGHDDAAWGTEFRGLKEADVTVALGEELAYVLSSDPHFEPVLVRTKSGYTKEFAEYFKVEKETTRAFIADKKKVMKDLLRQGMLEREEGIIHNSASSDVALRLYMINKWANEHAVDLVLHIHLNDYPRKARTKPGRYSGFALYVPDRQYSNAGPSVEIATSIARRLSEKLTPSTHPQEGAIVPDQELIAVGAYNTLDPAVVLLEYGYIYENRLAAGNREKTIAELVSLTHQGLSDFFRE